MSKMMFNLSPNRTGTGVVACSKAKLCVPAPAFLLYGISSLSKLQMLHSLATCSTTKIVSAKHGLVGFYEWIAPYDYSVYEMSEDEKHDWGLEVALKLAVREELDHPFRFYTGKEYYEPISKYLDSTKIHMGGDMFYKTKTYSRDLKEWGWDTPESYFPKLPCPEVLRLIYHSGPDGLELAELRALMLPSAHDHILRARNFRQLHRTEGKRIISLAWSQTRILGIDKDGYYR